MRRYMELISTCAICALTVAPVFAQTGSGSTGGGGGTTGQSAPTQRQDRTTQPGTPNQPGTSTQPGTMQPGTSQPGTTQSDPSRPGSMQSDPSRPGSAQDSTTRGQRGRDMSGKDSATKDSAGKDMHGDKDMAGKGGKAAHVRKVQEQLKAQGHDPGPIDGMMGPQTQQAIRGYQKQENLPVTGRLDQQTMEKLGVRQAS